MFTSWGRQRGYCGTSRGLFTHPSYLLENLARGFGLLYQVLIAVSTDLAGSLKAGWGPSKTSEASAVWQRVLHHSCAVKGERVDAVCR